MANLAQIQSIAQGQFFVKDSLGNLTELKVGDTVSLNDTIVAANSNTDLSKIEILFDTNELITLSQGEQLLDATLLASTFGNEELAFDKQEVDETLNAWNNAQDGDATDMETAAGDVTEQATNAGDERAADGGALRSKFNSRDGASTNVESDLRDTSFGGGNTEEPQEQIPTELLNPVDTRVPASVITLSDPIVKEGNQITIVATVTNPPQTDLIITLNNGQTITISAGQTTGSTTFTNPNGEDVYVDNSTETYTITGTTGGNYVSLDTSDSSVVTVTDTETPVTVDLTASIVNEDASDTSYVFTATLSEKSQGVTTIVTDKGTIEIADGQTTGTLVIASNNKGDVYVDASELTATISSASGGNFEKINIGNATATAKVTDTITPIDVTITATVTTPKIINVKAIQEKTTEVKITGINSDGEEVDLSIISGTDHDGFGVDGNNLSNGDTKELGVGEKIVVEFTNGKDVNSLDVSFAWRNNHETAKLKFFKGTEFVGYATVDGDGKSTTKAIVKYYDENNNLIKEVNAEGSSDRVDKAFTFELPDSNGGIVSFDKVEFSAPQNKDDYLIHEIKYKEVLNTEVTDIITKGGNVTFNIQIDEKYPPQGKATATVEVNGKEYYVELNSTGRGTLTIDSKELGDLSNIIAKVVKVEGGNYEKVNPTEEVSFNFTPTLKSTDDNISTDEDVSYTLKVTDFGEVSTNTKEFKITELPTNGKLFLNITVGDTIFNPDGTQTVATQDSRVEITKDQIVTLGQVGAGKVVFEPTANSDANGQFKFKVGDGNGNFSSEYTTTINVVAVADAPIVNISVDKIEMEGDWKKVPVSIPPLNASKSDGKGGNKNTEFEKNLGSEQESVKINLKEAGKIENINGEVRFYKNSDGTLTEVGSPQKITQFSAEYKPGNNLDFDTFKVINLAGQKPNGQTEAGRAFDIESYQYKSNENSENEYEVYFDASLTDTDGSETLSVVIKNVPEGATLYDSKGTEISSTNGEYKVEVPKDAKDISGSLTMKVPQSYKGEINLEIVGRSTETRDNKDGKNFKVATASDATVTTIDETSNITKNSGDTNLILTLDVSGSMVRTNIGGKYVPVNLDGKGSTRFDVVKESMIDTIKGYKTAGNTMVNLTLFAGAAKNIGWMNADDAIDYLNKLTMGQDAKVKYDGVQIIGLSTGQTDYKDAIDATKRIDIKDSSQSNAKVVGYFISDGVPNEQVNKVDSDNDETIKQWREFIVGNKIDLKVIAVGTPESNKDALKYLEIVQVMPQEEVIVINEPTAIKTTILGTVEGTVSGDITDNIFGGDGKVTIDSIVVGDTTYNKADYPYGLSTDKLGGKLTFDFETGKYTYNGNGENITTDISKSFQVNVSDKNGDKGSLDVNFELKAQPITDGLVKFEKGGDINFSNLENIVKLKEINLDNGKENKLSLTLDDVLKLSGDDGKIKITGDMFDSVAFKDDGWKKSDPIVDTESGTQVVEWTNTRDESVSVKIEQPISDGITS